MQQNKSLYTKSLLDTAIQISPAAGEEEVVAAAATNSNDKSKVEDPSADADRLYKSV